MIKLLVFLIANILLINFVFSQNGISVNTIGAGADNSAILDISSTSQGLLIPRLVTSQRNSIVSPATSLLIFNITTNCFESLVNGSWFSVYCPPPCTMPSAPTAGTNIPSQTQIVWSWNTVNGAAGYKWNTVNNYEYAIDNGTSVSYTQPGLKCNTPDSLYIWAYNSCGNSTVTLLIQSTSDCICTTSSCGTQVWTCANLNTGTQIPTSQEQTSI
jgi:hypothetical protein